MLVTLVQPYLDCQVSVHSINLLAEILDSIGKRISKIHISVVLLLGSTQICKNTPNQKIHQKRPPKERLSQHSGPISLHLSLAGLGGEENGLELKRTATRNSSALSLSLNKSFHCCRSIYGQVCPGVWINGFSTHGQHKEYPNSWTQVR